MAPVNKKEQPAAAPITAGSIAAGLAAADASQQLQALGQLAATYLMPADVVEAGIPEKLVSIVQQPDKSARLLACRLLASFAAIAGPVQGPVASLATVQVLWSVLEAYHTAEAAIAAALSDPAASKAVLPRRLPGSKESADPDDWLPGPSKFLLDAVLRTLTSLAAASACADEQWQLGAAAGTVTATNPAFDELAAWMAAQDVPVVVCLLHHVSGKIQMRAARLAHQLARSKTWLEAFAATGGITSAVHLATASGSSSSSSAVQLHAVKLLLRLAHNSHLATVAMVESRQLMDALMGQLIEAGGGAAATLPMPTTPSKAKAASLAAATAAAEATKPYGPDALQQAAAELLAALCAQSSRFTEQLVQLGGAAALQALLPDAPVMLSTADAQPATSSSHSGGAAVASSETAGVKLLEPKVSSRETTPRGATPAGPTPRTTATPSTRGMSPATVTAAEYTPRSNTEDHTDCYPTPGKATNPELQAKVLLVLEAVLSQPGMVQSMLLQTWQRQSSLPRLLLHMFAPAPAPSPAPEAAVVSHEGTEPTQTAPVKLMGTKGPAGTKAPAVATGMKKAGAAAAEATGAVTPRKPSGSGTTSKEAVKAAEAPAVPVADTSSPPFTPAVKAAALACLAQLAADKEAVTLLAEQKVQMVQPLPALQQGATGPPEHAVQSDDAMQQQQRSSVVLVPMLLQMLLDVQQLVVASRQGSPAMKALICSCPSAAATIDAAVAVAAAAAGEVVAAEELMKAAATAPAASDNPGWLVGMLEAAATVLAGLAQHLNKQQLQALPVRSTLKALAQCGLLQQQASPQARLAVARALLVLPEEDFVAPARPPLPSPPATPPPPPLPTSQWAWDALDRPLVTDGTVIVS